MPSIFRECPSSCGAIPSRPLRTSWGALDDSRADVRDRRPRQLRDRAYTYLWYAVREVRLACRYAFPEDAALLSGVASAYTRAHRDCAAEPEHPADVQCGVEQAQSGHQSGAAAGSDTAVTDSPGTATDSSRAATP